MDIALPQAQQLLFTIGFTLTYLAMTLKTYDLLLSQPEKLQQSLNKYPIPHAWVNPVLIIASLFWPIGFALRLVKRGR